MTKIELVKAVAEKTGIDQPTAMERVYPRMGHMDPQAPRTEDRTQHLQEHHYDYSCSRHSLLQALQGLHGSRGKGVRQVSPLPLSEERGEL